MKRSTTIAIIVIFISVVAGGLLGFYFYLNNSGGKPSGATPQTTTGSFGSPNLNNSVTLPGYASSTDETPEPLITTETTSKTPEVPMLRKIFADPVSGFGFFSKDIFATTSAVTETVLVANGTTTRSQTSVITPASTRNIGKLQTIQFVERATGHIYEAATSTPDIVKISNTTIPKIYEAMFVSKDSVLLRGLYESTDIISTVFANAQTRSPTSTEKTLVSKELTRNIKQLVFSPNKTKTLSLYDTSPILRISNPDGSASISLFDSEFKEWIIAWPNEKFITLTTKASAFVEGFAYSVSVSTKEMQKIIGDKFGLTTNMSPDGNKLLYSEAVSDSSYLSLYDVQNKNSRPLFFRTLAEKCVWSTKNADIVFCAVPKNIALGDYPDVWYLGLTSFSDNIWKINTKSGETELIADLEKLGKSPIDVINPSLNSDDSYMVFNNKNDLSFWGLQLTLNTTTTVTTPSTSTNTVQATSSPRR